MKAKLMWAETPIGQVGVGVADELVTDVLLPGMRHEKGNFVHRETELAARVLAQIQEYLRGESQRILAPIALDGSAWDQKVWAAVRAIPYGQTQTYAQVAASIGKPTAARSVGRACGDNRLPLIIPCHRVVAAREYGGFVAGEALKKTLIRLEKTGQITA